MKLYCTTYIDDADEYAQEQVAWYGTQADQKREARQFKADGMREINPQQVDVPTDKPSLLAFLNERGVQP